MNEPSAVFEIIHSLAEQPDGHLSVSEMCSIAGVSRSGYYAWIKAAPVREAQEEQDRRDFDIILEAYQWRGYSKGARGIYMRLLHMDPPVVMNVKKIRRLMDKYNLSCRSGRQTHTGGLRKRLRPAMLRTTSCSGNLSVTGREQYS